MIRNRAMGIVFGFLLMTPSPAQSEAQLQPAVPAALQGDWEVVPTPNPYSQSEGPQASVRITPSSYVHRLREMSGFRGAWDRDTGESMTWVKDDDGVRYCQTGPYQITVRTQTQPWQVDLRRTLADGKAVGMKGIVTVKDDTLRLSLGKPGKARPSSFDAPADDSEYSVIVAKRTSKKQ